MMKRIAAGLLLAAAMLVVGCGGGSGDAQQPVPGLSTSSAISESDAIDKAKGFAADRGLRADNLRVNPAEIFGEWQVSFEPTDADELVGGYLIVLDAETGELIDLIEYR